MLFPYPYEDCNEHKKLLANDSNRSSCGCILPGATLDFHEAYLLFLLIRLGL